MKTSKTFVRMLVMLLIGVLIFAAPASVLARDAVPQDPIPRDVVARGAVTQGVTAREVVARGIVTRREVAQQVDPPVVEPDPNISDEDILVFEPVFTFVFPFTQGFQISFNTGFSFEVPRRLLLLEEENFNFFLDFNTYIIPAQGEAAND